MTYRPLPAGIEVCSGVEGTGLVTTRRILAGEVLGIGHLKCDGEPDGWMRSPLGGFLNHSLTPNCQAQLRGDKIMIVSLRDIEIGEELTVFYWLESYHQKVKNEWK